MTLSRFLSRHALTDAEQAPLWADYVAAPSTVLAHRLVLANGSLAVRVAKSIPFSWARRHREDLIQAGLASLVRMVPTYRPERGVPSRHFSTGIHRDVIREAKRLRAVVQADNLSGNWFCSAAPIVEMDALGFVSAIGSTQMVPDTTGSLFRFLTPKQTQAVRLTVLDGLSMAEAGAAMGMARQGVDQLRKRAFAVMRGAIALEAA